MHKYIYNTLLYVYYIIVLNGILEKICELEQKSNKVKWRWM